MKANELFTGALARVNRDGLCIKKDTIVEVRGIDADDKLAGKGLVGSAHCRPLDNNQFDGGIWCEYLDSIPLTPEILEKNGFKDGQYFAELYIQGWHVISDARNLCMECERGWHMNIPCRCVHQLQHALRLCQIEKEIEL